MPHLEQLRRLGLFDARVPRYTSYPPANHFNGQIDASDARAWMATITPGSSISLYLHIPYCRRLCWFCACRTQGAPSGRPLRNYLDTLKAELALVSEALPQDIDLAHVHLGGGTPTLMEADMIRELGAEITAMRPLAPGAQVSVEIDPTEIDQKRLDALVEIGMNRASIGVQDFDPEIQKIIGREQSFAITRETVEALRATGVHSLNMDILYGLPNQTEAKIADSVQRVLSLGPDRVALFGYAHVPWMARRQTMIPSDAIPSSDERLKLFQTAQKLFLWDGYCQIGIDHFARPEDSLATAQKEGRLRRNFQGYTDDGAEVLVGVGASAISQYRDGYAQNAPATSAYQKAIGLGELATVRGHRMTEEDRIRHGMIMTMMCDFAIDTADLAQRLEVPKAEIVKRLKPLLDHFGDFVQLKGDRFLIQPNGRPLTRMIAHKLDRYETDQSGHSPAV